MAYETKLTRMTPAADFSLESLEQQIQQKFELEQIQQYLIENFPEETELETENPELAIEALGGEFFYAVWKNQKDAEKDSQTMKKAPKEKQKDTPE